LTAENRDLIGSDELQMVKPDVRIINVARGGLIDEAALVQALDAGRVAGAAIDVFDPEPPASDLPILSHPKVIVTPHLGASTAEAQERVSVDVADQMLAVLRGEPAIYAVNLPSLPAETFKVIAPYLAAATKAASLATQLSTGQFEGVEIEYLGELADFDTTPLKASVIKGLLAPISEENVTLVNAALVAEQRGLRISERKGPYDGIYKDLIRVHLTTSGGKTSISATVAHDGPHVVEINDFWVDVSPGEGYLLICENTDRPGMIGSIGTFLGGKDINISFMRVGRESVRGRALMVIGLDDEIDAATLAEIERMSDIISARTARI
jgi:D-3-phosphoglycerate dehydrogenase